MRHRLSHKKLNRTSSHRKAMLANMATALVIHEQIKTTLVKAKVLRPYVETLVTKAKTPTLATRRNLIADIKDELAADKLLAILGSRYKNRPGGYLRIIRAGFRYGDMCPMAYIEFVDRDEAAKGLPYVKEKKESKVKKPSPKKQIVEKKSVEKKTSAKKSTSVKLDVKEQVSENQETKEEI